MNKSECIVQCQRAEAIPESQRYDVFVSSRGVRYEFGPRRMKVVGVATPADNVEFVRHVRHRREVFEASLDASPVESSQVRVLGIRLG